MNLDALRTRDNAPVDIDVSGHRGSLARCDTFGTMSTRLSYDVFMPVWLALLGVIVLGGVGVHTAAHPNGGYRAVGGVGSGFSPGTRRAAGAALVIFAVLVFLMVVADTT